MSHLNHRLRLRGTCLALGLLAPIGMAHAQVAPGPVPAPTLAAPMNTAPMNTAPMNTAPMSAAPAFAAPAPDVTAGDYVLAPSDQLDISVQGHDELHQSVTVLSDGTFHYPIAGRIRASGKTVDALEADLTKKLSDICRDPQVTVLVQQSHPRRISVAGDVKTPGLYDYHPGMRLLELIAATGGPLQEAQLTQATLVTDGGARTVPIDLVALMAGTDPAQNVLLSPGDLVLFTPRDPETSMVQVIGQVGKPGQYSVQTGGMTVLSLLTEAGSATSQAALTQAQLMHAGRVQTLDLHPLQFNLGDPVGKTRLVAGDTLLIPENKQKIAVLGEVRAPAVYLIPDGETLPITQAIAEAGGPTPDGDKKQVGILRLGPDHTRRLVAVNLDALLKGDARVADADLKPGDILVVPTRNRKQGLGEYISQVPGLYYITRLFTGGF